MTNNELKYLEKLKQKKYRREEKKFLIEGEHLIEECLSSYYQIGQILLSDSFDRVKSPSGIKNIPCDIIEDHKFSRLSDTKNPQGILAVVKYPEKKITLSETIVVALDNINDPGNLGTILRTAYWFGFKDILLSSDSVEIYNPKVLRASQGAVFHLNILEPDIIENELEELYKKNYKILLTDPDCSHEISSIEPEQNEKVVIVFGNEAGGIRKEILGNKNYIRMGLKRYSRCESLNVSISAGIFLYELKKLMEKQTTSARQP